MKDHLYKIFADKWNKGGTLYFYSDPHFGDLDSYKFRNVFKTKIEDGKVYYETGLGIWEDEDSLKCSMHFFDEMQIKNINSKVGKKDTIIFLGDIGDINYIKKIRGYKVLIMGNHDQGASNYKREIHYYSDLGEIFVDDLSGLEKNEIRIEDNHLFDEVYTGPLMISDRILLSHEPIALPYIFNIHGHDHSNSEKAAPYHMNMCAEHIDYTPVLFKDIVRSGVLKDVPSIHRFTIDKIK